MSDLISRSALLQEFEKYNKLQDSDLWHITGIKAFIENRPTAYDVEQVVKELEELISMFEENNSQIRYERYCKANRKCKEMDCFTCVLSHAIEIVKGGGVNER